MTPKISILSLKEKICFHVAYVDILDILQKKCHQGSESMENRGKKTKEYASRRPRIHFKEEVHTMKQNCWVEIKPNKTI